MSEKKQIHERVQALVDDGLDPNTRITDMRITTRTFNCLRFAKIRTVLDLCHYNDKRMMEFPNFGVKCISDLHMALDEIHRRYTRSEIYIWVNGNLGLVKAVMDASIHEPVLLLPLKERFSK